MKQRAEETPYPKNLYRAHNHGYLVPRFEDEFMGKYCDSYSSDHHLWLEYDAGRKIEIPFNNPIEELTVDDAFKKLSQHLYLTQIKKERKDNGEEPYLSSFVSLSGHFRWTAQRACKIDKTASDDEIPGLALFETSAIKAYGVHIWRVEDMVDFLDKFKAESSDIISPVLRRWAENADEYVCWEFVPRSALVAFVPVWELTQVYEGGDEVFLTKDFVNSTYLCDLWRRPQKGLSLEEYLRRASRFMHIIMAHVSRMEVGRLDMSMLANRLSNPCDWGYDVPALSVDLEGPFHLLKQRWVRATSVNTLR